MIVDLDAAKRVATRALPSYGADTDAVLTFVKYRENYVFQVEQLGRTYALRLHRSGYRTGAQIVEKLELMAALAKAGVAVPQVCLTTEGAPFCRVADDDGDVHQVDMRPPTSSSRTCGPWLWASRRTSSHSAHHPAPIAPSPFRRHHHAPAR